jgi:acyl transferase domain-containing protein
MFEITEDTMPGELSNVIAGRIANLFNLRGPNYTTDAACAPGLAALNAAIDGLVDHQYDAVITGGIDRNMGIDAFVKFCKIGALSATGTRPFDAGADGFVMGEGAALFVLKRLEDAERDGDKIYSVILAVGGSSDGKGKGITAPNPVGQKLAVAAAWERAASTRPPQARSKPTARRPASATPPSSRASPRLRRSGRQAGLDRARLGQVQHRPPQGRRRHRRPVQDGQVAAREGADPEPELRQPQPERRLGHLPFARSTPTLRPWETPDCPAVRRGGVSAFGFGGTNFHVVVEEHVPGRHKPAPEGLRVG